MNRLTVKDVASRYGGFWNYEVKDFCYMTNRYFPPQGMFDSLGLRLRELVSSYPSTNWHISSLAAEPLGLTHKQVVVANGASELITAIASRFVEHLAVAVPTFDEFVNRAVVEGKRVSPFQLDGDFELDVPAFVRHVQDTHANAALVINPNSPSGKLVSRQDVLYLLESLRHLDLVLVDESFLDFSSQGLSPSVMDAIFEFPNLVILKSLSKAYGIPGLRLGYAVSGKEEVVAELRSAIPIWSINSLAQAFLEELAAYQSEFTQSCAQVRLATDALFAGLQTVPYLHPFTSEGNYVLSRVIGGSTGSELTARIFEECNILINDCGGKKGLTGQYVRMASRTKKENAELVEALLSLSANMPAEEAHPDGSTRR